MGRLEDYWKTRALKAEKLLGTAENERDLWKAASDGFSVALMLAEQQLAKKDDIIKEQGDLLAEWVKHAPDLQAILENK